jgi:hypothetical protein
MFIMMNSFLVVKPVLRGHHEDKEKVVFQIHDVDSRISEAVILVLASSNVS